jgi:hypothetical protein
MSLTVLLTTSGVGSRLGELTKHTNKCLVRVDDKPAISHIIESYPDNTNFVITLGHFGSHVEQFLSLAYPDKNFTFVNVDKYEGEGSSLGYSIYQCKEAINGSFIYHACDTIVKDLRFDKKNFIVGSKKENVSQFRTLRYSSNKIYDKGEIEYDLAYVGICGVEDHNKFFSILGDLLQDNFFEMSDVDVVNIMSKSTKFDIVEVKDWYDIGNNGELVATRQHFHSSFHVLDKPEESIYFFDDFVIKFFSNSVISENRVKRAEYLEDNVPEIIAHTKNFYKYKKVTSDLLASVVTPNSFISLLEWSKNNLWKKADYKDFDSLCFDFYYHKTFQRINKYLEEFGDSETYINDQKVPHILDLLKEVDFGDLSEGTPVRFHGDFILDNILYDGDSFKLLDWRQDFQGCLTAGDLYYDLAKLNHNLSLNHNVLDNNLFFLETTKDGNMRCEVLIPSINLECQKRYYKWLEENRLSVKKVKLLTSIIWLNMCPLHEYPLNRFLFHFGKYNLFLNLEEY